MEKHLKLLGLRVHDVVTGFTGVVTSICFDLFGCVQAIVTPPANAEEKKAESRWFDTKRLVDEGGGPVMQIPTFSSIPGGTDKPLPFSRKEP